MVSARCNDHDFTHLENFTWELLSTKEREVCVHFELRLAFQTLRLTRTVRDGELLMNL